MDSLRSSLYTIAITAVSAGILDIFTKSGALKKYVNYAVSLIVIIALLLPITKIISNSPNNIYIPKEDIESNDNTSEVISDTISTAIKNNITSRFSIPDNAISVHINTKNNNEEILIEKIKISIIETTYFPYQERIYYLLKSMVDCEVEVIQDIKE